MRAVVKYPVNATRDEKLRELRDGLCFIACELVGEHAVSLDQVEEWLREANMAAEDEVAAMGSA
jgi:hypothetical protein